MVDAENDGRNVDYRPTQGVRILKYNTDPTGVRSDSRVDIWDCSGDDKSVLPCILHLSKSVRFHNFIVVKPRQHTLVLLLWSRTVPPPTRLVARATSNLHRLIRVGPIGTLVSDTGSASVGRPLRRAPLVSSSASTLLSTTRRRSTSGSSTLSSPRACGRRRGSSWPTTPQAMTAAWTRRNCRGRSPRRGSW